MKTEFLTEITKFRLYSNYNTKNTLSENYNVIQEGLTQELKKLMTNSQVKKTVTSIVDNLIKKGDEFLTKKNVFGGTGKNPSTGKDVVNSIDKLDKTSLDKLKVAIINNLDDVSDQQINNMIASQGFIKKYGNMTLEQAKTELRTKGYHEDAIDLITSKFNQSNKFKVAVDKPLIDTTIKNLEKTYPNLFQTKWFGTSYVNSGRIQNIKSELLRDFNGKDAKGIETIINKKLIEAAKELEQNKSITTKQKGFFKNLIVDYTKYLKEHPIKGPIKTAGSIPVVAISTYILYDFIVNWYHTGNPAVAAAGTGADLWQTAKKMYNYFHSYDNNPDEFLKFLIENYGDRNYTQNFDLNWPNNNSGIISVKEISTGSIKYFKYTGRTFIEVSQ